MNRHFFSLNSFLYNKEIKKIAYTQTDHGTYSYDDELINELDACNEIADIYISHMENAGLCREIFSEDDLNENEYLVAFKSSIDDYHYARRLKNGRWFHKMGWENIKEISQDDVYDDMWWEDLNCYCGNLRLLAVKY